MPDNRSPILYFQSVLYRFYARLVHSMRSSSAIHRYLFGYTPLNNLPGEYWDWTTLAIRKALRQILRSEMSLLDMGTGPVGVLAIYARLKLGCERVVAADHLPELVASAAENAAGTAPGIRFVVSDLFQDIPEKFDVIVFNAPYIDPHKGRLLGVIDSQLSEQRWSGGKDGLETIERFLADAPGHLIGGGCVILGVNRFYLPEKKLIEVVDNSAFQLRWKHNHCLTRSSAYILEMKNHPSPPNL